MVRAIGPRRRGRRWLRQAQLQRNRTNTDRGHDRAPGRGQKSAVADDLDQDRRRGNGRRIVKDRDQEIGSVRLDRDPDPRGPRKIGAGDHDRNPRRENVSVREDHDHDQDQKIVAGDRGRDLGIESVQDHVQRTAAVNETVTGVVVPAQDRGPDPDPKVRSEDRQRRSQRSPRAVERNPGGTRPLTRRHQLHPGDDAQDRDREVDYFFAL